jgi:hypothetical protein
LCELFEGRFEGTLSFAPQPEQATRTGSPIELSSALDEAVRRCDELAWMELLLPENEAIVAATAAAPASGDSNGALRDWLWDALLQGTTPAVCGAGLPVDRYRIRLLLATWLADGHIRRQSAPEHTARESSD